MIRLVAFTIFSATLGAPSFAQYEDFCQLPTELPDSAIVQIRDVNLPRLVIKFEGNPQLEREIAVKKGEPILVSDANLINQDPIFRVSSPILLTWDGMFGPSKQEIKQGTKFPADREIVLKDGRVFRLLRSGNQASYPEYFLVSADGKLCGRRLDWLGTAGLRWSNRFLVGTVLNGNEFTTIDSPAGFQGIRIIFDGIEAGQLKFVETWIRGGGSMVSRRISVDQFSKKVTVGPLVLEIVNSTDGQAVIKYTISNPHVPPVNYCAPGAPCFR